MPLSDAEKKLLKEARDIIIEKLVLGETVRVPGLGEFRRILGHRNLYDFEGDFVERRTHVTLTDEDLRHVSSWQRRHKAVDSYLRFDFRAFKSFRQYYANHGELARCPNTTASIGYFCQHPDGAGHSGPCFYREWRRSNLLVVGRNGLAPKMVPGVRGPLLAIPARQALPQEIVILNPRQDRARFDQWLKENYELSL